MKKIIIILTSVFISILFLGCTNDDTTISTENLEGQDSIVSVSLGQYFTAVVTEKGEIYTWGLNTDGQLGDGTIFDRSNPVNITSQFSLNEDEKIEMVSLGFRHSGALTSDGRVFVWGDNTYGQVGDGTYPDKAIPVDITSEFALHENEMITSISFGNDYASAYTSEFRVFTWGNNDFGKLGNGTTESGRKPSDITSFFTLHEEETIQSVKLGAQFGSAITSEHRVFMWGMNSSGQLGDGTQTHRYTPVDITPQFNLHQGETIAYLVPGGASTMATTSEGRIFSWGSNSDGRIGDGTEIDRHTPVDITSQFNLVEEETIISITYGTWVTAVVSSTGRVFIWGNNGCGQLANNSTSGIYYLPQDQTSRFVLDEGEIISQVDFRGSHASALTSNARLFIWGCNSTGQLGDGTNDDNATPSILDLT